MLHAMHLQARRCEYLSYPVPLDGKFCRILWSRSAEGWVTSALLPESVVCDFARAKHKSGYFSRFFECFAFCIKTRARLLINRGFLIMLYSQLARESSQKHKLVDNVKARVLRATRPLEPFCQSWCSAAKGRCSYPGSALDCLFLAKPPPRKRSSTGLTSQHIEWLHHHPSI